MAAVTSQVIGLERFAAQLRSLDNALQEQALARALTTAALPIEAQAKANIEANDLIDTGTLLRSIGIEVVEVTKDRVAVAIGTNLVYAAIHEFGGEIRPRNGKFLSIPLTDEARGAPGGSPRNFPRDLSPRVNGNKGVLVDEGGVAQYALVTSVTIPARPYLRPAFDERKDEAMQEFVDALQILIRQAVARGNA